MVKIDQLLINDFKITIKGFNFSLRFISNKNDILDAIKFIYDTKSVLFRKRKAGVIKWSLRKNKAAIASKNALLVQLADRIHKYFSNPFPTTKNDFDMFHNEVTQWLLDELNKIRQSAGLKDAKYGNAQKMINVLFKYLVCFEDYPNYLPYFDYCHMPIDSYIMKAAFDNGVIGINNKGYTYNGQAWEELDKDNYLSLQEELDKNLKRRDVVSLLYCEFYLWLLAYKGKNCKDACTVL